MKSLPRTVLVVQDRQPISHQTWDEEEDSIELELERPPKQNHGIEKDGDGKACFDEEAMKRDMEKSRLELEKLVNAMKSKKESGSADVTTRKEEKSPEVFIDESLYNVEAMKRDEAARDDAELGGAYMLLGMKSAGKSTPVSRKKRSLRDEDNDDDKNSLPLRSAKLVKTGLELSEVKLMDRRLKCTESSAHQVTKDNNELDGSGQQSVEEDRLDQDLKTITYEFNFTVPPPSHQDASTAVEIQLETNPVEVQPPSHSAPSSTVNDASTLGPDPTLFNIAAMKRDGISLTQTNSSSRMIDALLLMGLSVESKSEQSGMCRL